MPTLVETMAFSETQAAILKKALGPGITVEDGAVMAGGRRAPVIDGIVRFRQDDGYNASFALQWRSFQRDQYDSVNGTTLYRERFQSGTGWPLGGLKGELILEAGCGAGAFTCHLAATGADLVSFDYSRAVDVAAKHNSGPRTVFAQADILEMPFTEGAFDRVFCHGVLQHTPDPERAFRALDRCLRPGGKISIDVYHRDGRIRPWKSKYLWRPLTTRVPPERLLAFLEGFIPRWLPVDTAIKRIPRLGTYLGAVVPCWNYFYTDLSPDEKVRWAIMDTFDALAAAYDNPVRLADVERWFGALGYDEFEVREGGNGIVGNGVKPGAGEGGA